MAIIPLKQSVTIYRPGVEDKWGNASTSTSFTLKCSVNEVTETVRNQFDKETVSSMKVMFDKLQDIRYDDEIEYTNELGVTVKRSPIKIEPTRLNGKPLLTTVYV